MNLEQEIWNNRIGMRMKFGIRMKFGRE